jgi:hypothetical protein
VSLLSLICSNKRKKIRALKEKIAIGFDDIASGRVSEWNFEALLREARTLRLK